MGGVARRMSETARDLVVRVAGAMLDVADGLDPVLESEDEFVARLAAHGPPSGAGDQRVGSEQHREPDSHDAASGSEPRELALPDEWPLLGSASSRRPR